MRRTLLILVFSMLAASAARADYIYKFQATLSNPYIFVFVEPGIPTTTIDPPAVSSLTAGPFTFKDASVSAQGNSPYFSLGANGTDRQDPGVVAANNPLNGPLPGFSDIKALGANSLLSGVSFGDGNEIDKLPVFSPFAIVPEPSAVILLASILCLAAPLLHRRFQRQL